MSSHQLTIGKALSALLSALKINPMLCFYFELQETILRYMKNIKNLLMKIQLTHSVPVVQKSASQTAPASGTNRKAFNIFVAEPKGNITGVKAKPFKRQGYHNCG